MFFVLYIYTLRIRSVVSDYWDNYAAYTNQWVEENDAYQRGSLQVEVRKITLARNQIADFKIHDGDKWARIPSSFIRISTYTPADKLPPPVDGGL